jgi:hypothetical protein
MTRRLTLAMALTGLTAMAGSVTINIDATKYGCSQCSAPTNIEPGTVLSDIYTPKLQLTLGPGTYTFTNADPNGTDYYSAWQFNSGPGNWVWSFVVANDSNSTVLMDDFVSGIDNTQSAMSNQTGTTTYDGMTLLSSTTTAGFTDSLVLGASTTVDFLIDDYILDDNNGGVSLSISGPGLGGATAPEPSSVGLVLMGLAGFVLWKKTR